jgi:hypothetical protein
VKPGALKAPPAPEPATASITDDVVKALLDGKAEIAQKIIAEAMLGSQANGTSSNKTATEVLNADYAGIETRMMAGHQLDAYAYAWKSLQPKLDSYWRNRFVPRYFFPGDLVGTHSGHDVQLQNLSRPAIEQRVYKSAAMGPMSLSQRAKDLLVENREAIQKAIGTGDYNADRQNVSRTRGKIAQYISELEQRVNGLSVELQAQRYRK